MAPPPVRLGDGSSSCESSLPSTVMTVLFRCSDSFFLDGGGEISICGSQSSLVRFLFFSAIRASFMYSPGGPLIEALAFTKLRICWRLR